MTYTEAKTIRLQLEQEVKLTGAALRGYPRNEIGLVSDKARSSASYRAAKQKADDAFQKLRRFNSAFTKEFASEIRKERAARS